MQHAVDFADALVWFVAFVVWILIQSRLKPFIREKIAKPMLNTDPDKSTSYIYRGIACVLLILTVSNLLSAVTIMKFQSISNSAMGG